MIAHGRVTATIAATPQKISEMFNELSVARLTALNGNLNRIAIGNKDVNASYDRGQGIFLYANEWVELSNVDLQKLWFDTVIIDDGLTWWAIV